MIALPAIIIYQTINFHHYIVDSIIWKARKKPMREALGLKGASKNPLCLPCSDRIRERRGKDRGWP
jgi:hypothetical protein